jgi:hypothetical protein
MNQEQTATHVVRKYPSASSTPNSHKKTRGEVYGHVTDVFAPYLQDYLGHLHPNNAVMRPETGDCLSPWYPNIEESTPNIVYVLLTNIASQEQAVQAISRDDLEAGTKASLDMVTFVQGSAPLQQCLLDGISVLTTAAETKGIAVLEARDKLAHLNKLFDAVRDKDSIHEANVLRDEIKLAQKGLQDAEDAYNGAIRTLTTIKAVINKYQVSEATVSRARSASAIARGKVAPAKAPVGATKSEGEELLAQLSAKMTGQPTKKARQVPSPSANNQDLEV